MGAPGAVRIGGHLLVGVDHHVDQRDIGMRRVRRTVHTLAEDRRLQLLPGVIAQQGHRLIIGRRLHLDADVVRVDLHGLDLRLELRQIGVGHGFADDCAQAGGFRHRDLRHVVGDAPLLLLHAADHPGADMVRGLRQVHHPQPHQGRARLRIIARLADVDADVGAQGLRCACLVHIHLADIPEAQRLFVDCGAVGHAEVGHQVAAGAQGGHQLHASAWDIAFHRRIFGLRGLSGLIFRILLDLFRVVDAQVRPGRIPHAQGHGPRGDGQHRRRGRGDQNAPFADDGLFPFVFICFHQKFLLHAIHGGEEQLLVFHKTSSFSRWVFNCLRRRNSMVRTVVSRMPVLLAISAPVYRYQ